VVRALSPGFHVREVEAQYVDSALAESLSERFHEGVLHSSTSAVSQRQSQLGLCSLIEEEADFTQVLIDVDTHGVSLAYGLSAREWLRSKSSLDSADPWREISAAVWTDYSNRQTAEIVGLSESMVRSCAREGLLDAGPDQVPLRFSFQDLRVLKLIKELTTEGISIRRVRRQLVHLRSRLGSNSSLAGVALKSHNGHVVVRESERVWRADNGQMVFGFEFADKAGEMREIPLKRLEEETPELIGTQSVEEWFEQALLSEESNPAQAKRAYQQVLQRRPDDTESLINLGRLHAEDEEFNEAALCFRRALDVDPREATALYNLGVIAQDIGRDAEAIALYEQALASDPALAEAHYNLATIFDRSGDPHAAIRHINEYRKLTKNR
jgi:DNA-binding transcriptional MerR regulator